jgi:flavin-dependent dehydrogenase
MVKILGAGPAGLCTAINLAKGGQEAEVFESKPEVGMRFHPNLQGLKYVGQPEPFMKSLNLDPKIEYRYFKRVFFGTRNRDLELDVSKSKIAFVERGGKNSLEHALFCQAEKEGVRFHFNSRLQQSEAAVIATGGRGCDFAAMGGAYEDTDFPRDSYLAIFDDRYSPFGWYSYIFPISGDRIEFVNCVSQPHVPKLAGLYKKALAERKILHNFLDGKRRVASFGGSGWARIPASAKQGGKYYVGEAAGFQDPFMGFGIAYALHSGKLAADAILGGEEYDGAWRKELMPYLRKDFARRFAISVLGDRLVERMMAKYQSGDCVDISNAAPENFPLYGAVESLFCGLEIAKMGITGYW